MTNQETQAREILADITRSGHLGFVTQGREEIDPTELDQQAVLALLEAVGFRWDADWEEWV